MKSSRTHFVLMLVLAVVTTTSYVFWYMEVSHKSDQVISLESKIRAAANAMNRISSSRVMFAEIAEDEVKLQSYSVSESGVVAFINDLESRGAPGHATVEVSSVSKGGTAARPTLSLVVTIEGTFTAVMTTLGSIEYAPYMISVSAFSLSKNSTKDTKDGKDYWRADVNLVVATLAGEKISTL